MEPAYSKIKDHIYVVILCGGGGTRLWPLSRHLTPKQFIPLLDKETLYQKTFSRIDGLLDPDHIFIITNNRYLDDVKRFSPQVPDRNIIAEPEKKNTALAMGVASAYIHHRDPKAVVVNLASDQLITNNQMFRETIFAAAQVAFGQQYFVTVGITPTFPHTGLGYIKAGDLVKEMSSLPVLKVEGFTEKPILAKAKEYLASGRYYWNANLYTWSTKLILEEFAQHAPHLYGHLKAIMAAIGTDQETEVLKREYAAAPEEQIDTAISEKTHRLLVIPGNFGWTDIGSWNVVHDEAEKDEHNNAFIRRHPKGDWLALDTENSLVSLGKRTIATIGVSNLMIIDTPDALLIVRKDRAQDVKKIVKLLKDKQRQDLL